MGDLGQIFGGARLTSIDGITIIIIKTYMDKNGVLIRNYEVLITSKQTPKYDYGHRVLLLIMFHLLLILIFSYQSLSFQFLFIINFASSMSTVADDFKLVSFLSGPSMSVSYALLFPLSIHLFKSFL